MKCAFGVLVIALAACGNGEEKKADPGKQAEPGKPEAAKQQEQDAQKKVAEQTAKQKTDLAGKLAALEPLVKGPTRGSGKLAPLSPPATEANTIVLPSDPAEAHALLTEKLGTTKAWFAVPKAEASAIDASTTDGAAVSQADLAFVTGAKYLALVTSIAYDKPYVATSGAGFYPGKRVAEVRLYSLPAGVFHGGARFEAKTDSSITTTGDADAALQSQLGEKTTSAMWEAIKTGGDAVSIIPGWNRIEGKGIAFETPTVWNLVDFDTKSPLHILSADYASGDNMQILDVYSEPVKTSFATDADCTALMTSYATELKAKMTAARLEQGTCVADAARTDGTRAMRIRYWEQDGKKYSMACGGPPAKADMLAQCDTMWSARTIR